jgi:hypothetical protein
MSKQIDALEDKKAGTVVYEENISETEAQEKEKYDLDNAAQFLAEHGHLDTSHIDLKALRRKSDFNVIGICCLVFIMQFLDKSIYNVSPDKVSPNICLPIAVYGCVFIVVRSIKARPNTAFSVDGVEAGP